MPKYQLHTQFHTKVWFSDDLYTFMNDENQLRLVHFRHKNPRATLTILYSSYMLTDEANEQFVAFCDKYNFIPLDFDTELPNECIDQMDQDLYQFAKMELIAFINKKGGNLAAASDNARLITPFLKKGIYSDFDTNIEVQSLPDVVEIDGPMIFDIGSYTDYTDVAFFKIFTEQFLFNNDIMGITMKDGDIDPEAKKQLHDIQKKIVTTYSNGAHAALKEISNSGLFPNSYLLTFEKVGNFNLLFNQFPNIGITDFRFFLDKSTRNLFSMLRIDNFDYITAGLDNKLKIKLKAALQDFNNDNFPEDFSAEEICKIKTTWAKITRDVLENILKNPLLVHQPQLATLVKARYNAIKDIKDPDECFRLLNLSATGIRNNLLSESVTLFSGPGALGQVLCGSDKFLLSAKSKSMSFDGNNLFDNFHSNQTLRLGSDKKAYEAKIALDQVGKSCDLSWLPHGRKLTRQREAKLHSAARTIQTMWRNHKASPKDKSIVENHDMETPSLKR